MIRAFFGLLLLGSSLSAQTDSLQILRDQFKYAELKDYLERRLAAGDTRPTLPYLLAQTYVDLGQTAPAKEAYRRLVQADSLALKPRYALAQLHQQLGEWYPAYEQYEELLHLDSLNPLFHKKKAYAGLKLGYAAEALVSYQRAGELAPEDLEVCFQLSRIYGEMQLYSLTDSLIQHGLKLDSTYLPLWQQKVRLDYRQKRYEAVTEGVQSIWRLNPDSSDFLLKVYGVSQFHIKNYQACLASLDLLERRGAPTEVSLFYMGLAHRERGNYQASAQYLEKAIAAGQSEKLGVYYTNLAISLEEAGALPESIKAYQAAYKSTRDQILLYHLARNYDAYYKDKNTALAYYEKYLKESDSAEFEYRDYSEHRISELKRVQHFDLDSL